MPLPIPTSQLQIEQMQSERKRVALARARQSPFYQGRLDHIDPAKLDDPDHWASIPILTKEDLRGLSSERFYDSFCLPTEDGIAEYWRSGGATGKPLLYPRSHQDMRYTMLSFARTFECVGLAAGERLHNSFPMGIHPVGQMYARAAQTCGIGALWAGAGTTTPSRTQIELIQTLKPSIWMGMSSYGLHLANLAANSDVDLASSSVKAIICSAEPLSQAKREKLARSWGAKVYDAFGMTEAGLMGAEDHAANGFRVWTDLYFLEVIDPESHRPVADGQVGELVVTPLWTNHCTPFLRWRSGDLVSIEPNHDRDGPFSVFPVLRHAHRTSGFFKVRGVNINHSEFEDLMFRDDSINDFKCEVLNAQGNDVLQVSVEIKRGISAGTRKQEILTRIKNTFEVSAELVILETGTLAREFEASVKAPRFADRR